MRFGEAIAASYVGIFLLSIASGGAAEGSEGADIQLVSSQEYLRQNHHQNRIEVGLAKDTPFFILLPKAKFSPLCNLYFHGAGQSFKVNYLSKTLAGNARLDATLKELSVPSDRGMLQLSCPGSLQRSWPVQLSNVFSSSLSRHVSDSLAVGFVQSARSVLTQAMLSPDRYLQMRAYFLMARISFYEGKYLDASRAWVQSLTMARDLGALLSEVRILSNLMFVLEHLGKIDEAYTQFKQLTQLRNRYPAIFEIPDLIVGYSLWYSLTGESVRLLEGLELALTKARVSGEEGQLVSTTINLAFHKLQLGNYQEARRDLAQIKGADWLRIGCVADATKVEIELAEKEGNPNYQIPPQMMTFAHELEKKLRGRRLDMWTFVAYALGRIAFLEGNYDKARDWLRRANTEVLPEQSASYRNDLDLLEGELSLVGGNYPKAVEIANRLIKKAVEQPVAVHSLAWRAYKLRAAAAEKSNLGTKKVSSDYQKAQLHLTSIARGVGQRTTRISFKTKYRQLPLQYADYLIRENKIGEGAAVLEHYRALVFEELNSRILTERLSEKGRQHWLNMLAKFEQARRKYERERGACELVPKAKLKGCQRGRRKDARKVSKLHQKVFEALKEVPPQLPKIERYIPSVQRMLLPGQALLTLTQTLSGWHSFYISAQNIEHYHGPQPLSPWVDRLPQLEHLYVVAGGHREARGLHRQVFKDKPLAAQISISYLPHAGVLIRPAVKAKQAGIVVADPEGDLPNAYQEAKKLLRLRKGLRSYLGETARREDILSSLSEGARWLHFAGHGIFAQEDPWAAHLKLADGETLSLEDLLVAQPKVELVVLNGCQTGPELSNEGMTLPQAFLLAGAQAVLATTDDIDDAQARRFIDSFYDSDPWANPGKAYRNAVIASASAGDEVWRSFRLWGAVGSTLR